MLHVLRKESGCETSQPTTSDKIMIPHKYYSFVKWGMLTNLFLDPVDPPPKNGST